MSFHAANQVPVHARESRDFGRTAIPTTTAHSIDISPPPEKEVLPPHSFPSPRAGAPINAVADTAFGSNRMSGEASDEAAMLFVTSHNCTGRTDSNAVRSIIEPSAEIIGDQRGTMEMRIEDINLINEELLSEKKGDTFTAPYGTSSHPLKIHGPPKRDIDAGREPGLDRRDDVDHANGDCSKMVSGGYKTATIVLGTLVGLSFGVTVVYLLFSCALLAIFSCWD